MELHTARALINQQIGDDCAILDSDTIEKPYGWIFFYQSKAYIKSNNPSDMITGNAPIIVNHDGTCHVTGTAYPLEHYVKEYEKNLKE